MRHVGVPRCFLAGNNQVGDLGQNNHTSLTFPRSHGFPNVSDFSRNFVSKILQQVSRCSERAIHHGVSKGASRVSHRRCLCHQYHLNHARLETKHHQRDVCHYFVLWLNAKAAVNDGENSGEWCQAFLISLLYCTWFCNILPKLILLNYLRCIMLYL